MIFVVSHKNTKNLDNAMDKFTSDFNVVYPRIGKVLLFEKRLGKLKIVFQTMDAAFLTFYGLLHMGNKDYIMLKFPFTKTLVYSARIIKRIKGCKIITILEDVNCIRYGHSQNEELDKTIRELEGNDIIMSPNNGYIHELKKYISKVKFVNFKIYPYMISEYCQNAIGDCSVYREGEICFAGNLNKSTFLEKISLDRYKMRLYGPCNENLASKFKKARNLEYCGMFSQDDLIINIKNSQYGLVWDGTDIDIEKDTSGLGIYLQYNTSSKFCLYLSIGLPVIVWEKAATAEYVKEKKCGIIVKSLANLERELDSVSESEYKEIRCNAARVATRIRQGYDFIDSVEEIIGTEVKA